MSRDKIVGLLWPDTDEERARHSLTQTLYLTRQAVGRDDLFLVGADIRLNPAVLATDVAEFEAALSAGEEARAVELYRGQFLDGFVLADASEFEHWLTSQRSQFEDRAVRALDALAQGAENQGDLPRAVTLRKRAAALRPLDSSAAFQLMRVLAASGDRAGALQHAQVHESLLRDQLDLGPSAQLLQFAAELRKEPRIPATAPESGAALALSAGPVSEPDLVIAEQEEVAAPLDGHTWPARPTEVWVARPRPYQRLWQSALVAGLLITLGFWLGRGRSGSSRVEPLAVRQQVVVAPFRVAGASGSLSYLREGLVELLSTRLADDSAARSVDAGAVLGAWRRAGLTTREEVARDTVVQLAGRLGAKRVVVGNVVGARSRAVLSATVLQVPSGAIEGQASVEGPADSIAVLVDRLAARLLASQAGEDVRLADRTTSSLPALRAYLQGQAAYREAAYASALRYYTRALDSDPTFALAALRLAVAADRLNDVQQQRRALAIAWQYRSELDERELAHLVALAGPAYPKPSAAADQLHAWERLVALAPDRAEAWYELGARLFRDGRTVGITDAHARAVTFFQRALAIDPTFQLARQFLLQLGAHTETGLQPPALSDTSAAATDSLGPLAPFIKWRMALARSDSALLRSVRDTLSQLGPYNLRTIALASQFDGIGLIDGFSAMETLLGRATRTNERVDALLGLHSLAMLQGRPEAAREFAAQIARAEPGARTPVRLQVLDGLYGDGDQESARVAAAELERVAQGGVRVANSTRETDLCILGQWRLARSDTNGVAALISRLRSAESYDGSAQLDAPPGLCADMLSAGLAVRTRGRSALPLIQRLDSLALSAAVASDLSTYAHLFIARLYSEAAEPALALAAIRRRPYMAGWPRYLATAWREEGLLAEATGDRTAALIAYQRFLALRASPEARLQDQVATVQARINALQ